jgi:hypothetical protein
MTTLLALGLVLGWGVGALIGRLASALALDERSEAWGLTAALARGGIGRPPSQVLRLLVYWGTFVIFATMGIEAMALPGVPGATGLLMGLLTRALTALLILVVGVLTANFLGHATLVAARAGLPRPPLGAPPPTSLHRYGITESAWSRWSDHSGSPWRFVALALAFIQGAAWPAHGGLLRREVIAAPRTLAPVECPPDLRRVHVASGPSGHGTGSVILIVIFLPWWCWGCTGSRACARRSPALRGGPVMRLWPRAIHRRRECPARSADRR